MIDLYFWPTGNGKKTVILLEELGLPYTIKPINIGRGDQLTPEFLRDFAKRPDAGDRRLRAAGRRCADLDLRVRPDHDVPRRKGRTVLSARRAQQIRCCPMGRLAVGQSRAEARRARPFPARRGGRQQWRSDLRAAPLRQRGAPHLRRHEPRPVQQALPRRRPVHDRRHDLLSLGVELGDPQDRHRRVPEREKLARRDRRAPGGQEGDGDGTGVPRGPASRSAPKSRRAAASSSPTSGRRRSPGSGCRRKGWHPASTA